MPPKGAWHDIAKIQQLSSGIVMQLKQITDRNQAEALTGKGLQVSKVAVELREDEFLWDDLIGTPVKDAAGKNFGSVTGIYNAGASDIATVADAKGATVDIPLVADFVDLKNIAANTPLKLVVDLETFAELWTAPEKESP